MQFAIFARQDYLEILTRGVALEGTISYKVKDYAMIGFKPATKDEEFAILVEVGLLSGF